MILREDNVTKCAVAGRTSRLSFARSSKIERIGIYRKLESMASQAGSTIQANLNDFTKQNRMKVAQPKGKLNSFLCLPRRLFTVLLQ